MPLHDVRDLMPDDSGKDVVILREQIEQASVHEHLFVRETKGVDLGLSVRADIEHNAPIR
jgi:hypothetical protein